MTKQKEPLFSLTKKDFIVDTFRAGGKGGQKQNKTESGVRIRHPASGAVGESREERSQHRNKDIAFDRLIKSPKFRVWHAAKCAELLKGETVEETVEKMMVSDNLKVEARNDNGRWADWNDIVNEQDETDPL